MKTKSTWFEDEKTQAKHNEIVKKTERRADSYKVGTFEEEENRKFFKKYGQRVKDAQVVWTSKQYDR